MNFIWKFKRFALIHSQSDDLLIIDIAHKIFLYKERIPKQFLKISQKNLKEMLLGT
jgi:hypothetical protein